MMGRTVVIVVLLLVFLASGSLAASYNYLEPDDFKNWIESGKKVQIVDIQVPQEFQKHHFKGSLETNAYPVKSPEEKQLLDKVLPALSAGAEEIVVVCPRGGGGAKNAYDYLKGKGISETRLYVLQDGIKGWPYQELLATGKQ